MKQMIQNLFKSSATFEELILSAVHNPSPRSSLFPYRFFRRENQLYYNAGKIAGFILESAPIVGCDSKILKQISLLFEDLLPPQGMLEVLLIASDDLTSILQNWSENHKTKDAIFKTLEDYRLEFFKNYNLTAKTNFRLRNYRLFFAFSSSDKKAEESCIEFRSKFQSLLHSINMDYKDTPPEALLRLIREIAHYPDFRDVEYTEHELISEQLSDISNALLVDTKSVLLDGGKYITRTFNVEKFPPHFNIANLPLLLGDSGSDMMQISARFTISYIIANELPPFKQEEFKRKGDIITQQARGLLGTINRELRDEADEWKDILERVSKDNEKFLTRSFSISITAQDGEIDKAEQNLIGLWKKNDFVIKPNEFFHLPILLTHCPFISHGNLWKLLKSYGAVKTILSSEPKALLPIHAEWRGHSTGGMILSGRRGQIFTWDCFENASNYNVCVTGMSGSGKSVFLQEFVMNQLTKGARVFVVDIGRSFEKTCKLFAGDYISFGSKSNISLNPFSNIPTDESSDTANVAHDSLSMLKFVIAKMAAPKAGTLDIQDAAIASAIMDAWDLHKNKASIDKLVQILQSKGAYEQDVAMMLFEYTSKGHYGRFFGGNDNIAFKNQFTVLEFEELRSRPDLAAVIMQMLSIQILQQVYLSSRQQRFIILFDEAWYALQHFPMLLGEMARTVRKYNGSLVLGTQSLNDFYGAGVGEAEKARLGVIENCEWRVLLKQKSDSLDKALKLGFSDEQVSTAQTLDTVDKQYSECIICQSNQNFVVARLMLDRFSQILYSSSPEVFAKVQQYISSGLSTINAIEKTMRNVYVQN